MKEGLMLTQKRSQLEAYLEENQMDFEVKEINYGVRYTLFGGGVSLNMYEGKKGFSYHFQGKDKDALEALKLEVGRVFEGKAGTSTDEFSRSYDFEWIGSDESGKGDSFGPLVCAGVRLNPQDCEILVTLGLADSKKLNDRKIQELAKSIKALGEDKFKILVLKPGKYNELYDRMASQGKSLNDLMTWAHSTVIEDLARKETRLAVVDQFAKSQPVKKRLQGKLGSLVILERTKAEENLAVAAASILARDALLSWHFFAKRELGFALPLGSGAPVKSALIRLVKDRGVASLSDYGKTHFKTVQEFCQ